MSVGPGENVPHRLGFVTLRRHYDQNRERWLDPVHPAIARLVDAQSARQWQVLLFQKAGDSYFMAAQDPHSGGVASLVATAPGPVRVFRCEALDLLLAQDRVYGVPEDLYDERLGGIFYRRGQVTGDAIHRALSIQSQTGSKLGDILTSANAVSHWGLAEALARQQELPLINLLEDVDRWSNSVAWNTLPEIFWREHLTVPLEVTRTEILVAMVDPTDRIVRSTMEAHYSRRARVFVTGYRDVLAVCNTRYHDEALRRSIADLIDHQPENSAYRQLSTRQVIAGLGIVAALGTALSVNVLVTGLICSLTIQALYTAYNVFRLGLMYLAAKTVPEIDVSRETLAAMDWAALPRYTVLVPLFKEANVLPTLVAAIKRLDYPKDRLDVKLLLEGDDVETIQAAKQAGLPNYVEILTVPLAEPRTKPKACNFGLAHARGKYVVIFDAEDIPEPDQLLKAVTVLQSSAPDVACVQAKLSYFNTHQNLLTRWFTAEYANWFDVMLPALYGAGMPVPLGGTSNHFKVETLRAMGAWDPFNVTEDADLGIRLHKSGFRTVVMNSTTYEEANADFVNWIRQRSRWLKGYVQTWLVHMRRPIELHRKLKCGGALGFHAMIGGTPFTILLNPLLWGFTVAWYGFGPNFSARFFPGIIYYLAVANLFLGNFTFVYINMIGLAKRQQWSLMLSALLFPLYWGMMSVAAWKGVWQLVFRPSYWEKTTHGLASDAFSRALIKKDASH